MRYFPHCEDQHFLEQQRVTPGAQVALCVDVIDLEVTDVNAVPVATPFNAEPLALLRLHEGKYSVLERTRSVPRCFELIAATTH